MHWDLVFASYCVLCVRNITSLYLSVPMGKWLVIWSDSSIIWQAHQMILTEYIKVWFSTRQIYNSVLTILIVHEGSTMSYSSFQSQHWTHGGKQSWRPINIWTSKGSRGKRKTERWWWQDKLAEGKIWIVSRFHNIRRGIFLFLFKHRFWNFSIYDIHLEGLIKHRLLVVTPRVYQP